MLGTVPDAVLNVDADGRLLYLNPSAEQILGRDASSLIGRVFWEEIAGIDGSPIETELRRAIEEHRRAEFQAGLDGSGRMYKILLCPCEDGLFVFLRDVSEQHRLHEALEESEAWRRLIIENVKDFAILSLDREGRVTLWNPGAEKMFGYRADEILGHPTDVIFVPEDRAAGVRKKNSFRPKKREAPGMNGGTCEKTAPACS